MHLFRALRAPLIAAHLALAVACGGEEDPSASDGGAGAAAAAGASVGGQGGGQGPSGAGGGGAAGAGTGGMLGGSGGSSGNAGSPAGMAGMVGASGSAGSAGSAGSGGSSPGGMGGSASAGAAGSASGAGGTAAGAGGGGQAGAAGAGGQGPVGAEGGIVTSADGKVTLSIPAGALAAPTPITIEPINVAGTAGQAYEIGPTGTKFAIRATLTFERPAEDAVLATLVDVDTWSPLEMGWGTAKSLLGATPHLSVFAPVKPSTPSVLPACLSCTPDLDAVFKTCAAQQGATVIDKCSASLAVTKPQAASVDAFYDCVQPHLKAPLGPCTDCLRNCCVASGGAVYTRTIPLPKGQPNALDRGCFCDSPGDVAAGCFAACVQQYGPWSASCDATICGAGGPCDCVAGYYRDPQTSPVLPGTINHVTQLGCGVGLPAWGAQQGPLEGGAWPLVGAKASQVGDCDFTQFGEQCCDVEFTPTTMTYQCLLRLAPCSASCQSGGNFCKGSWCVSDSGPIVATRQKDCASDAGCGVLQQCVNAPEGYCEACKAPCVPGTGCSNKNGMASTCVALGNACSECP